MKAQSVRKVLRITQSPMNRLRWLITLECGHEKWITRRKRPTITRVTCFAQWCEWCSKQDVEQ